MNKKPSSKYLVRFSDCDLFGHLNNARYIDYFLNAREDHLKEFYQLQLADFYKQGVAWVVGSHEISYLKPAVYNEEVIITSTLLQASENSLLVEMEMQNLEQTQIKALLWTTFIPVNPKTGKRENHPDTFMHFATAIENQEEGIAGGHKARTANRLALLKKAIAS